MFTKFTLLVLTALSGCGTLAEWKASMSDADSPDTNSRAPASVGSGGPLTFAGNQTGFVPTDSNDPSGPNLSKNEFSRQSNLFDEKAQRGIRRNSDPWEGTGPVNEGSLWSPQGQDGFYFARNTNKKVGDLLIVRMESDINEALNQRIGSILGRTGLRQVVADEAGKAAGERVAEKAGTALGNANVGKALGGVVQDRTVAALDAPARYIEVDEVSVRITEVLKGNVYKVEGAKRVLVKGAPYTLRMVGQVRDEDLGPSAYVSSNKVMESRMELIR